MTKYNVAGLAVECRLIFDQKREIQALEQALADRREILAQQELRLKIISEAIRGKHIDDNGCVEIDV